VIRIRRLPRSPDPGATDPATNQIPPIDTYIEPFAGGAAVLSVLRPAGRTVAIDLDERPLAQLAGRNLPGLELYHADGIEWLKHEFGLYRYQAAGSGDRDQAAKSSGSASAGTPPPDPATADPAAMATAGALFTGEKGGGGCSWPRCLVYCDPPYPLSSRRSAERIYRHEMTDQQHAELLAVLRLLPCLVIVSSYPSPLYQETLKDWRRIEFRAQTHRGTATEILWCNYPAPRELHDYSFLGNEKRERERIRKKVRLWSKGLLRLPELERQAIVDAITRR